VNDRISYLAGIHIVHFFLEKKNISSFNILNSKSNVAKFVLFTYEAMFAYFFSKIINPHRKCDMYIDFEHAEDNETENFLARKILDSKDLTSLLSGQKLQTSYETALLVGHLLGEYLYLNLNQKNEDFSLEQILNQLQINKKHFHMIKNALLKEQDYKKHIKRYF